MFVVLVYDFGEKRVGKALKRCRKYLNWVQNSVFEGELSQLNLRKLKDELRQIMVEDEDAVIIYTWRTEHYSSREILGLEKGVLSTII